MQIIYPLIFLYNKFKEFSKPYLDYYPELRSFFKPSKCLFCIYRYGELAGVCFIDVEVFNRSQPKVRKKRRIAAFMELEKLRGRAIPIYDMADNYKIGLPGVCNNSDTTHNWCNKTVVVVY